MNCDLGCGNLPLADAAGIDIFYFIKKIWGIGIKVGYKDDILSWAR